MPVQYKKADKPEYLAQIIALQEKNMESAISSKELASQGFVTVKHTVSLLAQLSGKYHHIIACEDEKVVGYALVMLQGFASAIPVLVPMFEMIDGLSYQSVELRNSAYLVMGQVCIDKPFRGQNIFPNLYNALKTQLSDDFEYIITEVATRNVRSLRAHERVGFETIAIYQAGGEEWAIILWDWK